jgi:exopolyphosphatase/guanosine-5'-triphosphate,3'-diphosphate pyrophosphatase
MGSDVVAALDCGTNSTRLLIADEKGETLERLMRITRLGGGVDRTHSLADTAIDRTLHVLRDFRTHMDRLGVERARLVATSAVRDADNGDAFLREATAIVGVEAELLAGDEEGRLAFLGATTGLPPARGDDVVVDIGGGSTELVVEMGGMARAFSMDVGCVRLTERHLVHDPPTPDEIADATTLIDTEIDRAMKAIPRLSHLRPGGRLIGLAGTVSTLMALELGLVAYDRERIHHGRLTRAMVVRWCNLLAAEPSAARAARPGMLDGRQDVIVGGALVLRQVMDRLAFDASLVSEADILDGLVMSLREGV